jgi:hypothetical protein
MNPYLTFVNDNYDIKSIVRKYTKLYAFLPWIHDYYISFNKHERELFNKGLCSNPYAIDILKQPKFNHDYDYLSMNKNPDIIQILQHKKHFNDINWSLLSRNPAAIEILEKKLNEINWIELSTNSNAYNLIKNNQKKINWEELSYYNNNFKIIQLLKKHNEDLYWSALSRLNDDRALLLLQNNKNKIDWDEFSSNPHPKAVSLLLKNPKKIDFSNLSLNSNEQIISYLEKNTDKIYWENLCRNHHPKAIELIIKNPEKPRNWFDLSKNPYALELLKNNKNKINKTAFATNPAIFEEYDPLKTTSSPKRKVKSQTIKNKTKNTNTTMKSI